MRRTSTSQAGWRRLTVLLLALLGLAIILDGCTPAGNNASRSGNARVVPSDVGQAGSSGQGQNQGQGQTNGAPANQPATQDGSLSSTELGLVYQYIIQRYVERVDASQLLEGAIAAVHETGMKSGALPIDLAPTDMAPAATGDPERDWAAFSRGYDAIVGKHPEWAAQARPDWAVLRKMLGSLHDDHSIFIAPDEVRRMAETGFTGVGIRVNRPKLEDPPYVVEVFRDSPALAAGMRPGDQIMAVDGQPTQGRSTTEILTGIRGQQGTRVVLSVVRGGQPPTDIRITRASVDAPRVEGAVRGGVLGMLKIRSFGDGVPETVQQLLTQGRNRGARVWVVDLRGNPGGSLEAMARVAANFIENRSVGMAVDRSGQPEPLPVTGRPAIPRFPFVVLVDRETASGAEVLAAAIKEYQLAPVVGNRTAGSAGIAIPQALSDGSAIQLTVRRLLTPKGQPIDKQGVQPDAEADLTMEDLQRGDDPQLLRALELLSADPALAPPPGAPAPAAAPSPAPSISR